MSEPVRQLSFSGGEVAPAMYARTDHIKYDTGLRTLRNMICMRHGGVTGRPGTMYVGTTQNGGARVRLIPFIFNETGTGQSYVIEFGNLYIAFYQNGGVVLNGAVPYVIASPYLQADLATLDYAQSADVLTIVHPNYAPRELNRFSPTNWTLTTIVFSVPISGPPGASVTGTPSVGENPYNEYAITSVGPTGEESDTSNYSAPPGSNIRVASPTSPITIKWSPKAGASYYNVYLAKNTLTNPTGPFGFIGSTAGLALNDTGILPDYNSSIPINNNPFSSANNYPSTVGFVQQRRVFGSTLNNPIGFWMSRTGLFSNFDSHITAEDSDSVSGSIAGEQVNAIQHILELKFMLMLTAGAELFVQGNGNGVVTPSAVNASVQSQFGASKLKPLKVGDVFLFNQALGSFIRDFSFDFAIDGYRGNDTTVFSSHLFEGYSLQDWTFQKIPDSILWAARNDGVLLSCTYLREQQILAWSHHDFINGTVENMCSIPENGNYAVYLVIRRVINHVAVRYLERLSSRIWSDPLTATYLDCFSSYDGRNTSGTTMLLGFETVFQTGPEAYTQYLPLQSSAPFFTPQMIGDEIFIQDEEFANSNGESGNQIRCVIISVTNSQNTTVLPNKEVPVEFHAVPAGNWSRAVKTVQGLDYLEGQDVSVWADRFVVGSPLNRNISTIYTVTGGSITLDKCYAVIYVGLPMTQDFEPLDLETSVGPTMLAKRKRTGKVSIYTYKSRSLFAGSENPDKNRDNVDGDPLFQLVEQMHGTSRQNYDEPSDLGTKQDYVSFDTRWNYGGRMFIRNVDPIPMSILSIAPEGEDPSPVANYKKV